MRGPTQGRQLTKDSDVNMIVVIVIGTTVVFITLTGRHDSLVRTIDHR
jgi:hypothetical protein